MADQIPVRIYNYYPVAGENEQLETIKITINIAKKIYGNTLSDNTEKTKHFLIVAPANNVDALATCPFATYLENIYNADCPVLVTQTATQASSLTQIVSALIASKATDDNNLFDVIYIIGGSGTLPDSLIGKSATMDKNYMTYTRKEGMRYNNYEEGELLKYTTKVQRLSGYDVAGSAHDNRYTTSIKIAQNFSKPKYLFFCNGAEPIDAYSLVTAAAYTRNPLLYLKDYTGTFNETEDVEMVKLKEYLISLKNQHCVKKIFIAGGSQRNFNEIEEYVKTTLGLTAPNSVERIAGQKRQDTSLSISKEFNDFFTKDTEQLWTTRAQLIEHIQQASTLIITGASDATNDAPTSPMLAVYYKCPLIINAFSIVGSNPKYIKPEHRYYNIMSYLQMKRPQVIFIFSDYGINNLKTSDSGKEFQNLVKFYNGTLGDYIYDSGIVEPTRYDIHSQNVT